MTAATMKAARLHAFGGPDVLHYEDAPRPTIGSGEVLVRVHVASINPPDLYLRDGYRTMPPEWRPDAVFPLIIGTDMSGVVEAVADDVTGFRVGDEVFAMVRFPENLMRGSGAYAEYVGVPASELALKPAGIDHVHAGGAPMSLLTAWQFLIELGHDAPNPFQAFRHEPVPLAGKTVLVNGAGGGVGHLLVQLAKWQSASVIAVASARNEALMHDLGVDRFIDYRETKAEEVVRDVDLVVDAVGGKDMERFLRVLKRGGRCFSSTPSASRVTSRHGKWGSRYPRPRSGPTARSSRKPAGCSTTAPCAWSWTAFFRWPTRRGRTSAPSRAAARARSF